jgi:hypothetical protein
VNYPSVTISLQPPTALTEKESGVTCFQIEVKEFDKMSIN